jgi:tetratricopeptide (TPR) repeat protein
MKMKVIKNISWLLVLTVIFGTNLRAQDRNEVINVYNEGAKAAQSDFPAAIASFEKVITLADKVGPTCDDLKQKAVQILPGLYFKVAYAALNEKKPASDVIRAAKAAQAAAEKYNSKTNKDNSDKVLIQAYNALASEYAAKNDYTNAIATYDSVLAINPGYTNAIYNKALIYSKQENSGSFEQTMDALIEKLKSTNDTVKVKQASIMALEYFRGAGSRANQTEKLDDALALLTKASKYGEDKDLYYYFADVYNKQKKFDLGAENAQKGLALEKGDAPAKAKFYFQLAMAQSGKGQKAEACASFKNAMYGPFAEPSKVQRTKLKCE